jgi:hypothetical protein
VHLSIAFTTSSSFIVAPPLFVSAQASATVVLGARAQGEPAIVEEKNTILPVLEDLLTQIKSLAFLAATAVRKLT